MKMIDHNKPIQQKKMPIREKKIKKLGTLKPHYVESTPFVWKDETKQILIPKRVHHA